MKKVFFDVVVQPSKKNILFKMYLLNDDNVIFLFFETGNYGLVQTIYNDYTVKVMQKD